MVGSDLGKVFRPSDLRLPRNTAIDRYNQLSDRESAIEVALKKQEQKQKAELDAKRKAALKPNPDAFYGHQDLLNGKYSDLQERYTASQMQGLNIYDDPTARGKQFKDDFDRAAALGNTSKQMKKFYNEAMGKVQANPDKYEDDEMVRLHQWLLDNSLEDIHDNQKQFPTLREKNASVDIVGFANKLYDNLEQGAGTGNVSLRHMLDAAKTGLLTDPETLESMHYQLEEIKRVSPEYHAEITEEAKLNGVSVPEMMLVNTMEKMNPDEPYNHLEDLRETVLKSKIKDTFKRQNEDGTGVEVTRERKGALAKTIRAHLMLNPASLHSLNDQFGLTPGGSSDAEKLDAAVKHFEDLWTGTLVDTKTNVDKNPDGSGDGPSAEEQFSVWEQDLRSQSPDRVKSALQFLMETQNIEGEIVDLPADYLNNKVDWEGGKLIAGDKRFIVVRKKNEDGDIVEEKIELNMDRQKLINSFNKGRKENKMYLNDNNPFSQKAKAPIF